MEEPVADMVRGILDGHLILDREIAERGRYPAINLRRSVSRSLPDAASADENSLLKHVRQLASKYEDSQTLIQAGLYSSGTDPLLDEAIHYYPKIEHFISLTETLPTETWFERLAEIFQIEKPQEQAVSEEVAS